MWAWELLRVDRYARDAAHAARHAAKSANHTARKGDAHGHGHRHDGVPARWDTDAARQLAACRTPAERAALYARYAAREH